MATGPSYNRFSAIAIGGPNTNTIPTDLGFSASLDVSGNVLFKNDLRVLGTLTYSGAEIAYTDLLVSNDANIGNQLGVTGPTELYSTLNVGGTGTFNGPVSINNDVGVTGTTNLYGDLNANIANFLGPVGVTGTTNLYGTLNANTANFNGPVGVTGITNLYGTLNANTANFNGPVGVTGNINIGGTLGVTGNTQLTNLTTSGNTNINGTLGVTGKSSFYNQVDFYDPTDATKDLKIGYDINEITRITNVTGLTSAVTSGVAFRPVTFTVPKNNIYNTLNFSIPLNLFSGRAPITGNTGTWTLTYSSVTMNVYKNSVLQPSGIITPTGFTSGTAKTGTQISSSGAQNIYMWAYWGYFDCSIPIDRFNTSTDTYEIELIVTGTATHSFFGSLTLWVASIGGYMGYGLLTNPVTFTQTRMNSPSGTAPVTWLPSTPTYIAPFYNIGTSNATIMSRSKMDLVAQDDISIVSNNSFRFTSINGYFTSESANNFYYDSSSTSYSNIYKLQGSQAFDISLSSTQNIINSVNIPLQLDTGTAQLRLLGNTLALDSGTSIAGNAGTTIDFTSGTTFNLTSGTTFSLTAGTNNNLTLTTTGTGDILLTSADIIQLTGPNGINFKNQIYFDRTPSSTDYSTNNRAIGFTNDVNNTGTAYTGTASDTTTPAQVGTFTLPARGVWLIQFDCLLTLNTGSDTITNRTIVLSETTASGVPCAPGFDMTDPIDDPAGGAGARQTYSFCGTYHLTASATKALFINVIAQTSGTRTVTASGNYKYTRIA